MRSDDVEMGMDGGAEAESTGLEDLFEPRLWREEGWTAKVVRNEGDEGWAVEMYKHGVSEVALVGPWTMGRDKKNPKPLDRSAFLTLTKTAKEFLARIEQQAYAKLHREVEVGWAPDRIFVKLDIVPEEDFPYGVLTAFDESGNELGRKQVRADFKLGQESAQAWIDSGYKSK